jgi:hypothetical protein
MKIFRALFRRLKGTAPNLGLLFMMTVFTVAFLQPTCSHAQAVPPRVQNLMVNKPTMPQPEQPLQKEIRQVNQNLNARVELERRKELQRTRVFFDQRIFDLQQELAELRRNPLAYKDVAKYSPDKRQRVIDNYEMGLLRRIEEYLRLSNRVRN